MRNRLMFCVPILLCAGVLIAPATFAAGKSDVLASELFDPLRLLGDQSVGWFVAEPRIRCPGAEPTGNPEQPCPPGRRTHLRDGEVISRVESTDPRVTGWMTVIFNANVDANFEGPAWGTFSLAVDSGGVWEGTWQGLRVAEGGYWTAALNVRGQGYGGIVDGMKLMVEDQLFVPTPLPFAYLGSIEGRIIDPN